MAKQRLERAVFICNPDVILIDVYSGPIIIMYILVPNYTSIKITSELHIKTALSSRCLTIYN